MEEHTYDRIMDINLKGLFFSFPEVARHMMQQKRQHYQHSFHNSWECWADAVYMVQARAR